MSFLVLFFFLLPFCCRSEPCPPCGSTPVPFPLSSSPSCNDPAYPVLCDPNASSLSFPTSPSFSYPITRISTDSQRLVLRPAPFLPSSSCLTSDFPLHGFALPAFSPFNITSSNTLLYLNCTRVLLYSPLNCSSSSPCRLYAAATPGGASCRNVGVCCTLQAGGGATSRQIKTSGTGCSAYRSFVGLDVGRVPPARWGEYEGVELQWASPREPRCQGQIDCEDVVGAMCRADAGAQGVTRCFCVEGFVWNPVSGTCTRNTTDCSMTGDCHRTNNAPLLAGLLSGLSAALLVSVACFLLYRRGRHLREARDRLAQERQEILNANNISGRSAHNFTGREIKKATNNFSRDNLLGSGGYGEVFKGSLPDGTVIAVKLAKLGNTKSTDQVLNEVRILSQVNHRSLVRLLGCCVELEQPLMVYEFIPNGTLFDHLHGLHQTLSWRERLSIAHQTAEGLAYLHFSAVPSIYHRDVKSSNILLDEKLNAKVSDFGLSRLAETDLSHVSTCAQGTLGYLDPEYYRNYQLTDKSDVYSFGVVLLELLTSQKAIDFSRGPDDVNLAVYVQGKVEEERLMEVVDPELIEGASPVTLDTMKAVGFLAVGCLEEKRQNRPSMKEVAEEIDYIIKIELGVVEHASSG